MRVFPAIDLRGGACVQLVGGEPDAEKIRLPDPMEVARRWKDAGFKGLHVVDLDAALGTGSNAADIEAILRETTLEAEVGGGVRDAESIQRLLDLGASRVIVGTRGVSSRTTRPGMTPRPTPGPSSLASRRSCIPRQMPRHGEPPMSRSRTSSRPSARRVVAAG